MFNLFKVHTILLCNSFTTGYNTGYGQSSGWGNQNPWDSNQGGWGNQGYGDQGSWGQTGNNFGSGYQQGYSGGPMRPNYNTARSQPYNAGKFSPDVIGILVIYHCSLTSPISKWAHSLMTNNDVIMKKSNLTNISILYLHSFIFLCRWHTSYYCGPEVSNERICQSAKSTRRLFPVVHTYVQYVQGCKQYDIARRLLSCILVTSIWK